MIGPVSAESIWTGRVYPVCTKMKSSHLSHGTGALARGEVGDADVVGLADVVVDVVEPLSPASGHFRR